MRVAPWAVVALVAGGCARKHDVEMRGVALKADLEERLADGQPLSSSTQSVNRYRSVLSRFDKVLLPEMNMGQLALLLRARFLKDVISYTKVQGRPFFRQQVFDKIVEVLGGSNGHH